MLSFVSQIQNILSIRLTHNENIELTSFKLRLECLADGNPAPTYRSQTFKTQISLFSEKNKIVFSLNLISGGLKMTTRQRWDAIHYNNGGRGDDNEDCDKHDGSPNWWLGDQVSDFVTEHLKMLLSFNMSTCLQWKIS